MLSIGRGYDVGYLTKEIAGGREGYYTTAVAAGEPAGTWSGAGAAALGLTGEVDAELLEAIYHHLQDPGDPDATLGEPPYRHRSADTIYRELLAGEVDPTPERRAELRAHAERAERQPLRFLDATFNAQKSISLLGVAHERAAQDARRDGRLGEAAAHDAQARAVEDAVRAGSAAMLAHLQAAAGLARAGHHGGGAGRWVDANQWVVASFLQHDSRDHDPHLHVHNAILNRQLCADGKWRALDSRAIHRERAAAGAIGERVMEAVLTERLGVRFEWRQDGKAREVVGVDEHLIGQFSSRRRAVTERAATLLARFTERAGRDPSAAERDKIMRQATLGTRAAKTHTGESIEQRLDRWAAEAAAETRTGLAQVLLGVRDAAARAGEVPTWSVRDVTMRAVALAAERKASWTRSDLLRAVSDCLPADLGIPSIQVPGLLGGLADEALGHAVRLSHVESTADVPAHLLRADGSSQYSSGEAFYAAPWQLAAERALAERATARGGEVFTAAEVTRVLSRAQLDGRRLGADQEAAIRNILTGGAAVDVLRAPAGTGKTYVVGILADAWTDQTVAPAVPERRVFGLTTSQNAANVLAGEGLTATANITAWSHTQGRLDDARTVAGDESWRLRTDDLVIVDEAGMVDTAALAAIAARCKAAGAKLLLTGDPRQLGAVGAGGALGELFLAAPTHELVEVRRFTAGWEGPASLRLRDGDTTVIAEYTARGRVFDGGTAEATEAKAVRAWLADHLAGKDAALVVGSNDTAARVNAQVRAELIRLGRVTEDGVHLGHSGEVAGVGDIIAARLNGRALSEFTGHAAPPVNRDQYRVTGVGEDGSLRVARLLEGGQLSEPITLPAEYVAGHVSLGYAGTAHSVQGRTVDTSHVIVDAGSDPGTVYVGLSRGKDCNTAYAVTQAAASDAPVGAVQHVEARPAEAVLADAMTRRDEDTGGHTATAVAARAAEQAAGVHTNLNRLSVELAEHRAGHTAAALDRLVATGQLTRGDRVALAGDQRGMALVDRLLRDHELAGRDREQILTAAVTSRGFGDAHSPASALYARIATGADLAPRLTDYTGMVPAGLDEATHERLTGLARAADARRSELGAQVSADPPAWAVAALGPVPADVFAAHEWETKAGWTAAYRELSGWTDQQAPLGPDPGAIRAEHRAAWRVAHEQLNLPDSRAQEAELSEAQHRARIAGWEHERRWAPAHVDDQATATARAATADGQDATIWAEHDRARPDEDLRAAAGRAGAGSAKAWAKHQQLDEARDERAAWLAETAVTRDKAERSAEHLRATGVDPAAPAEQITAEEWFAEWERELAEDEATRAVTERDVEGPAELLPPAEDAPETAVPDIRDTSTRHPSEDTDNTPRDRVPDAAEVDEIADRARDSAAERAARDEQERRWHDDDTAERAAPEAVDEDVDEYVSC
jgi:conjugative relaxase-like TrwC/TraI family protein